VPFVDFKNVGFCVVPRGDMAGKLNRKGPCGKAESISRSDSGCKAFQQITIDPTAT